MIRPSSLPRKGSPLLSRAALSRLFIVSILLLPLSHPLSGAQVDAHTGLVRAIRMGDEAEVRRLVEAGTPLDFPKETGEYPPLYHALDARQFGVARFLVEAGAEITARNATGQLPIRWAARAGDVGFVRFLMSRGANPGERIRRQDGVEYSAVMDAIVWDRLEVLQAFVEAGASLDNFDPGRTALGLAVEWESLRCARYFLERGANPNRPENGNTLLSRAVFMRSFDMTRLLLEFGADANRVSRGEFPVTGYGVVRHTPLYLAVLRSEPELVKILLQAGADPQALDNAAIRLADMLGDAASHRLLRDAGAPDPGPHPWTAWARDAGFGEEEKGSRATAEPGGAVDTLRSLLRLHPGGAAVAENHAGNRSERDADRAEALRFAALAPPRAGADDGPGRLPREVKFAIVNTSSAAASGQAANAESLLAAMLSQTENAVVLDRPELRRVLRERAVQADLARSPGDVVRAGRLLGADVLILLATHRIGEKNEVIEARIAGTGTGLVLGNSLAALEPAALEAWARDVRAMCIGSADKLLAAPEAVRVVSVAPVVASVNTPDARELERQTSLLLAHLLGRSPGVILAERAALERLAIEGEAAGQDGSQTFRAGGRVLESGLEVALDPAEKRLSLELVLRSVTTAGQGAEPVRIVVEGTRDDLRGLAEEAVARVVAVLAPVSGGEGREDRTDRRAEAAQLARQAEDYGKRGMWTQASAAAEAAWALGARDDALLRLRLEASTGRVLFSSRLLLADKRARTQMAGIVNLMSFRVPLAFPAEDDRELSMEGYLDEAQRILDFYEAGLAILEPGRGGKQLAGKDLRRWMIDAHWEAAAAPLRFGEPLSWRNDYAGELDALRSRLSAVHARSLALAEAAGDAGLVQSLVVLRCKNLPWWLPDVADFEDEVMRVLAEWRDAEPPRSTHAVWGGIHEIARQHTNSVSGRARQSWVKLGRRLAASDDMRERFLGMAIIAGDSLSYAKKETALAYMREVFPQLVEEDAAVPGEIARPSFADGPVSPFDWPRFAAWYAEVLERGVFDGRWSGEGQERRFLENRFSTNLLFSDGRAFWLAGLSRRFELLGDTGRGGFFGLRGLRERVPLGEAPGEGGAEKMRRLVLQAAERCQALIGAGTMESGPCTALLHLARELREAGGREAESGRDGALVLRHPRMYFGEDYLASSTPVRWLHKVTAGGLRVSGETEPWIVAYNGLTGRQTLLRLDREGNVAGTIRLPEEKYEMVPHLIDVSDRWVAGATGNNALAVLDRRTGGWRLLEEIEPQASVRGLILRGDKVCVSFEYSPQVAGDAWQHRNTVEEALRGVVAIDLATGGKDLLVSSRRRPARSPLDEFIRPYEGFFKTGTDEFFMSAGPPVVWNCATGAWREGTADERREAARAAERSRLVRAGGALWSVQGWGAKNTLRVTNAANSRQVLEIAYDLDYGDLEGLRRRRPELVAAHERTLRGGNPGRATVLDGGVLIENGIFYFWLSEQELGEIIVRHEKAGDS
ncbi:hypothetical protein OPIT5_13930 [Opitutaceae bacterium TAV5]|nr:hypothetical protein OPIT5_13930 [Opitutaceae bacterium TAV5]